MTKFFLQLKKTLKSEITFSLLQGAFGVVVFWIVLRFYLRDSVTPEPHWIILNFLYTVSVTLYCNFRMITGRWSALLWANRSLLLSLPLPAFYGYFTFLAPEYFPVMFIFVISIQLPVLGLARSVYLTLWFVTYYFVFFGLLLAFNAEYLQLHIKSIFVFLIVFFFMHVWLLRASESVRNMGNQLTRHLVETKKHKRNIQRLHRVQAVDLTLARRLQQDTLPDLSKTTRSDLNIAAKYFSLEKIGGDFYDVVNLGENKTGFFISDVSGHGVASALVTMMTKAAFRNHCQDVKEPDLLLGLVNRSLCGMLEKQDLFVTAFYCVLDKDGTLTYASAGHQPALVVRENYSEIYELKNENTFILGIEPSWKYYSSKHKLKKNDKLILFTDGLIEAKNKMGRDYGESCFEEFLLANARQPAGPFLDLMMFDLEEFMKGKNPEDDIAILCVDFRPNNPPIIESDPP
ncbi:PP2C family protein-serine/threonine phosphatase [Leptospira adleri]|uniref:Serine/threonine protein phosphatase n=1 Tax=Leptospira adleri TaxID=2023186 RepID=A0A2M9YLG6_9LEPT|nr:PP2C family protein-serine/threonine phosphatase [Leptospira adleri]PJZ52337.1 serine/threonine protein phosphatase [Leptospira adleri]PJZ63544.1 serine/threonine protein phosphatase [Leptospira adleri]